MPAHAVTFTAQWRSDGSDPDPQPPTPTTKYTVTYALGGGTGTVPTETDKEAGAKFDLASGDGLTKENHTFDGWSRRHDEVRGGRRNIQCLRAT